MRKISASVLVLVALLAIIGSVVSVFARASNGESFNNAVHIQLLIKKLHVLPNSGGGGYTPAQLRKAYSLAALTAKGAGITVAIIDACGNAHAQSDLNHFDAAYHLPATTIKVVTPQGTPCSDPQGWGVETDLDIQMVHAFAPAAHIVLEAAKSPTFANLDNAAKDAYTR